MDCADRLWLEVTRHVIWLLRKDYRLPVAPHAAKTVQMAQKSRDTTGNVLFELLTQHVHLSLIWNVNCVDDCGQLPNKNYPWRIGKQDENDKVILPTAFLLLSFECYANSTSPCTIGCIQQSYSLRQYYRLEASNLVLLHDDDDNVYLSVTIK